MKRQFTDSEKFAVDSAIWQVDLAALPCVDRLAVARERLVTAALGLPVYRLPSTSPANEGLVFRTDIRSLPRGTRRSRSALTVTIKPRRVKARSAALNAGPARRYG